ncbi:hypothetical protein ABK040_002296 [Willaertia magna]
MQFNRRFKIIFQYLGTKYEGYQKQNVGGKSKPKTKTIQGEIENAINKYFNIQQQQSSQQQQYIYLVGSSRTDAGVHALHNTGHFDIDNESYLKRKEKYENSLHTGMNFFLSEEDICICKCEEKPLHFHSRFFVKEREYQYRILIGGSKSDLSHKTPFLKDRFWTITLPYSSEYKTPITNDLFNVDLMRECANLFLGKHNFSNFCKTNIPEGVTRERTITEISVTEHEIEPDINLNPLQFSERICKEIRLKVRGHSFLQHQIRMMVYSLVNVALGKISKEDIQFALDNPLVTNIKKGTAPACGLYLTDITYYDDNDESVINRIREKEEEGIPLDEENDE